MMLSRISIGRYKAISGLLMFWLIAISPIHSESVTEVLGAQVDKDVRFSVVPFYVGHGSATLIRGSCFSILNDAGGAEEYYESFEMRLRSELRNKRHLDALILTHEHIDHIGYVSKLKRDGYTISRLITNRATEQALKDSGVLDTHFIRSVSRVDASLDDSINRWTVRELTQNRCNSRVQLEAFWGTLREPLINDEYRRKRANNNSVVVGMRAEGHADSVLMLGDANRPAQRLIRKYKDRKLEAYKNGAVIIGHHGISNGIEKGLLGRLKPRYAVISRSQSMPMIMSDIDTITKNMKGEDPVLVEVICKQPKRGIGLREHVKNAKRCTTYASKDIMQLNSTRPISIMIN